MEENWLKSFATLLATLLVGGGGGAAIIGFYNARAAKRKLVAEAEDVETEAERKSVEIAHDAVEVLNASYKLALDGLREDMGRLRNQLRDMVKERDREASHTAQIISGLRSELDLCHQNHAAMEVNYRRLEKLLESK